MSSSLSSPSRVDGCADVTTPRAKRPKAGLFEEAETGFSSRERRVRCRQRERRAEQRVRAEWRLASN